MKTKLTTTIPPKRGPQPEGLLIDYNTVKEIDDILGGNSTQLEGFAKGTNETKITKGQRQVDEADARLDVDEGPDIDMSDYED